MNLPNFLKFKTIVTTAIVCGCIMTGCVDEQREWVEDLYLTQSAVEHGQSVNSAQLEKRLGKPDAVLSLRQFSDAVPQNQPRRKVIINDVQKCAKKHDDKVVWVYDESGRYSKPLPFPVLFGQDTEFHAAIFTILRNDEVSGGFIVENWKGLKK